MNAEQKTILTTLVEHIDRSDHDSLMTFLREVHCQIDDATIANCALTMLYHDIAPRPLPGGCCDDDGEHVEIMLNEATYLLAQET